MEIVKLKLSFTFPMLEWVLCAWLSLLDQANHGSMMAGLARHRT